MRTSTSRLSRAMMTSQLEAFSALLALCAGNSPVAGEFPAQRPVTRSFDVFFDLRLNERLSKHSWGWWSETPPRSLWRQCNGDRKCSPGRQHGNRCSASLATSMCLCFVNKVKCFLHSARCVSVDSTNFQLTSDPMPFYASLLPGKWLDK